jgi:hypothetical protein
MASGRARGRPGQRARQAVAAHRDDHLAEPPRRGRDVPGVRQAGRLADLVDRLGGIEHGGDLRQQPQRTAAPRRRIDDETERAVHGSSGVVQR